MTKDGKKLSPVTWAALEVYALTLEGKKVEGLGELLRAAAPVKRLQSVARSTAAGLGVLGKDGKLTESGVRAARSALHRLGFGSAGGGGQ